MRLNVAGFIDVGFVRAAVADACALEPSRVRLDAAGLVRQVSAVADAWQGITLRTYWYDGQFPAGDPRHVTQRKYLDAVGATAGIQLRLGHVYSRVPAWHEQLRRALDACGVDQGQFAKHFDLSKHAELTQKGVDTLLVLDLVRLGRRGAYDIAVLFSGDRDIVEAVREAQSEGRRVILLSPGPDAVSRELRELADDVVVLDAAQLRALHRNPGGAQAAGAAPMRDRPQPEPAPEPASGPALELAPEPASEPVAEPAGERAVTAEETGVWRPVFTSAVPTPAPEVPRRRKSVEAPATTPDGPAPDSSASPQVAAPVTPAFAGTPSSPPENADVADLFADAPATAAAQPGDSAEGSGFADLFADPGQDGIPEEQMSALFDDDPAVDVSALFDDDQPAAFRPFA